ncbi:MAG TPA: glycosyltransferase [Candidatus Hydrogenedentes bacterium]|nr:glycosyltransferase [Candidatus Hydrogenedentota bacterium]HRK36499.1 glycosyltransferase [Candidatus Hydrogenedentota bacterium]
MRIGVNILGLEPGYDEEDVYLRNVLVRMREIQPDSQFILFTDAKNHDSFAGWERVFVGKPHEALQGPVNVEKTVDRAAKASKVDLVFSPLQTASEISSVPVVPYVLDLSFVEGPEKISRWGGGSIQKEFRKICGRSQVLVAPSEHMRRRLLALLGVPMDKVVVSPPGADPGFENAHASIAQEPYLVTCNDTRHREHLAFLLDAFAKLTEELPHNLVIIGRPDHTEPSDWGPRVLRIHQCPVPQRAGLLQHSDAYISASLHEGACITILEAMRAGARIIAPRVGGVPEIASTLPIFYNHESVASLMGGVRRALQEEKSERARQIAFARSRAREYTWERCAWTTLSAFKKVHA